MGMSLPDQLRVGGLRRLQVSFNSGFSARLRPARRDRAVKVFSTAKAKVHFRIQQQVNFGDVHKIVGNTRELGRWKMDKAPEMAWSDGDVWTLDIDVPAETNLEFKCVKVNNGHAEWEEGNNRTLQVPNGATSAVSVGFSWGQEDLSVEASENGAASEGHEDSAGGGPVHDAEEAPEPSGPAAGEEDDRPEYLRWQGREATFMQANDHSRERGGIWDATGLEGAARALVEGDEKGANWLSKMQVAKKVLVDDAGKHPTLDALANAFIYLQWINTGAIECKEGGGHYRPNKHAELARDIFKSLERAIGGDKVDPMLRLVARKTQTKLPSFTEEYTQSTPLTRIRDIAHRNDIPHELKQEIKHTIQNKLHRNAGPEDLVATEAMLKRIAGDSSFSQDFVSEFKVFTAELRDFFNAGSFADMLAGVRPALDKQEQQGVDHFLEAKGKADGVKAGQGLNELVGALHSLTSLRATLISKLSSGLRNDASDAAIAMRQRFRLCEIRAEDYAFVLLSRILNFLDQAGGAEGLAQGPDSRWALPLGAAVLSIRQVGLGGWAQQECMALENELGAWQQAGGFDQREPALRLKATLERVQRLTQGYTDGLLHIFPPRVAALGKALGLEGERVQVFTEAEVRASLMFQLSKLCSLLLKAARLSTGGAEWDALVSGEVSGKLVEVDRIEAGVLQQGNEPVVLLVKQASGDEEVGTCGVNLRGVILCHGLPHLSHLGVRARQERVVFVACEDESVVDTVVRPLIGSQVTLSASLEAVTVRPASEASPSTAAAPEATQSSSPASAASPSKTSKVDKATVVPLEEAKTETCGSKSAACAQLARLAAKGSSFATAAGVCLPFGNMEAAIKEAGKTKEFEELLGEIETAETKGGALDAACEQLQQLVASVSPSQTALKEAGSAFGGDATVIVRSSANVEDLAGMSGAGLYDSIPNVPAGDAGALGKAVAEVWASLYTRRAVLSRRAAGVTQGDASMAVLIQEQLTPDLSFVLHTSSPLDKDDKVLYAELAAGLGETLASGTRGSPWRLSVEKSSGSVATLAFANFSQALGKQKASGGKAGAFGLSFLDYSRQALSTDADKRAAVGKKLADVGSALEKAFGGAQDVEGALVGEDVYIVQTRPQP